ncbi:MAG: dihydrofolate reductase family protein [Candidatus Dormibacteria bacterium]
MSQLGLTQETRQLRLMDQRPGLPSIGLPEALLERYGGPLMLKAPCLYANFVATVDGVVALEDRPNSGSRISGRNPHDRFVMGLLRSVADAVVVAAGTFRETPGHRWTAEHVAPDHAGEFAALRRERGLSAAPLLVLVSGSGDIDPTHPALESPTLVLTSEPGAARLGSRLPTQCRVRALGPAQSISAGAITAALRDEGLEMVLTEGGPALFGTLVAARAVDQLFLTLAPRLAGPDPTSRRRRLLEGEDVFLTGEMDLLSLRAAESFLFLQYRLGAGSSPPV